MVIFHSYVSLPEGISELQKNRRYAMAAEVLGPGEFQMTQRLDGRIHSALNLHWGRDFPASHKANESTNHLLPLVVPRELQI